MADGTPCDDSANDSMGGVRYYLYAQTDIIYSPGQEMYVSSVQCIGFYVQPRLNGRSYSTYWP